MFEDDDNTEVSPITLTINKSYAKNYENWRQKEEKQKRRRYGSDAGESSDEEPEDDNAQEWTEDVEKEFLRCYSVLKKRDPKIYDENTKFFNQTADTVAPTVKSQTVTSREKPLKMDLKMAEIKYAMSHNDGNDDDEEMSQNKNRKSIVEEEQELKQSFKTALKKHDEETDDNNDFLVVKAKTNEQQAKEEQDYIEWLKGQKQECKDEAKTDLNYLHDYWNDPKISERDRFLRDYILNKMYLQENDDRIPSYQEIIDDDDEEMRILAEDEEHAQKQEDFERKYNFRFEEPDAEFIKQYPRTIADSVRRKDDRRKEKRESYKRRKEMEKNQKLEEIKRLKNLKKKEILDKIEKLRRIAGNEQMELNVDDLEEDFDPKEYDKRMHELFNEDYYKSGQDEEQKPEVSDDELLVENWDRSETLKKNDVLQDNNQDDVNEIEQSKRTNSNENEFLFTQQKKKKKSKFRVALEKEKPIFNPKDKTFEEYFNEYYKLDCEDIIGDMPVRFQYREVLPNDFGLTVDEILTARDKELNAWCSLKKTCQYRSNEEEIHDQHLYKNKSKNMERKQKILSSVYLNESDDEKNKIKTKPNGNLKEKNGEQQSTIETTTTKKKKRKHKKTLESVSEEKQQESTPISVTTSTTAKRNNNKNSKKKFKTESSEQQILSTMTDDRLEAYGLNPKRFRKFLRFKTGK
ncbi:unnamed protein product [Didymodactylos carnosus]|uniref:Protein KRI1 homolog n=1 Tax=Didymodactylos carnosus TaxID=1234261 RepID=A0A813RTQ1_9BILA|nr:unnamed protein product [Didymodactylos carnosus]CAF0785833.1 unnamed protein product [Didymodactylos carnosus]CAF3540839.1 unnamed protein product [Didymodactylos carnosus]CAF3569553.1 unnamed protein product [Didymodactylos carnosus]